MLAVCVFVVSFLVLIGGSGAALIISMVDPSWMPAHQGVAKFLIMDAIFVLGIGVGLSLGED